MIVRRVLCVFCVVLLALGVWLGPRVYKLQQFWSLHGRISDRIMTLEQKRPVNITPEHWTDAVGWAITAFCNLWPWDDNAHKELQHFADTLEEKMDGGDSLATVRWISEELEKKKEIGPFYLARWMPVRALNPDPITDESMANFWGLEKCFRLDLSGTDVGDAGLVHLAKMKKLASVNLTDTRVTGNGLALLAELPLLSWLMLKDCHITGKGFANLSNAKSLATLNLQGTGITNAALASLKELPKLQTLFLDRTAITDGGLAHLSQHRKIKHLSLSDLRVIGPGLEHLSKLTFLTHMDLSRSQVTDTGLSRCENWAS